MDLQQLRSVITIAETGSMTKAAELLHIVQPALSRKIRLLEQELGTRIFERTHAGMRLTAEGNHLVQAAKQALFILDQVATDIRQNADPIRGTVTLGLLPSTCNLLAGDLTNMVKEQFPGVKLRFCTGYTGQLQEWIENGQIDIALLYSAQEAPSITIRPLIDEPLFLIGLHSLELNWADYEPITTLARLPLILPTGSHSMRGLLEQACAASKVPLNIVAEADDSPLTKALLMAGVGYTVLPGIAVADELQRNTFSAVPIGRPPLQRRVALAIAAGPRLTESTACVAELFEERIKKLVRQNHWPGARLVDFD